MVFLREHYYLGMYASFSIVYIFSNSYCYGIVSRQGIRGVKLDVLYSEMSQCQKEKQYQRNTTPLSEGSVDSVNTTDTFVFSQEPVNGESGEVTGQKATDVRWPFLKSGTKFEEAISECSKADQEPRQQPGKKGNKSCPEAGEELGRIVSKEVESVKIQRPILEHPDMSI